MRTIKGFVLRGWQWADDCQLNLDNYGYHNGEFPWIYDSKEKFRLINGDVYPNMDDVVPIKIEIG